MSLLTTFSSHPRASINSRSLDSSDMSLSRMFSRRSNRTDTTNSGTSNTLGNSIRSSMSFSKNARDINPSSSIGGTSTLPPPVSINPFTNRAPSTRRPPPQQGLASLGGDAPPAYTEPIAETADDRFAFLTSFDTVFLIDDSGSMAGSNWRETSAALAAITPICTSHDKDGVDVHFLNHLAPYTNLISAQAVERVFNSVRPMGGTLIAKRLREILVPYVEVVERNAKVGKETKAMNLIVITDGASADEPDDVIIRIAKRLEAVDAPAWQLGIQFFQVGRDREAEEDLRHLDDELVTKGGCPRDIVDTVPWNKNPRNGGLDGEGVLKVVLGAVNRKLDRKRISGEAKRN